MSNRIKTPMPGGESLYARIMADPVSRDAYLWAISTDAYLTGDPDSSDVQALRVLFDSHAVRFQFLDDEFSAFPVLNICGNDQPYVGEGEIRLAVARFLTQEVVNTSLDNPLQPIEPSAVL